MAKKILDQYELTHKMNYTLSKVFKTYLRHVESTPYEDMLIGDHGEEGCSITIFNVTESKAKRMQDIQDELVK